MGTSIQDLRDWFAAGKKEGATHMLVVCDTFDYGDYPVYVKEGEDPKEKAREYDYNKNMQKLMEVYDLRRPMEEQMKPGTRVFNW